MAKKSKKIEKETRRLIEGVSDLVKIKGGKYKFKTKNKKAIKKLIKNCPHWIIRKGREVPAVTRDPKDQTKYMCMMCKKTWPIRPLDKSKTNAPYKAKAEDMLETVNQIMFWAVKLGGDKEDTKMFLRLKNDLPRFGKVAQEVSKRMEKRAQYEDNKAKTNSMDQFNAYSGFNYNYS